MTADTQMDRRTDKNDGKMVLDGWMRAEAVGWGDPIFCYI